MTNLSIYRMCVGIGIILFIICIFFSKKGKLSVVRQGLLEGWKDPSIFLAMVILGPICLFLSFLNNSMAFPTVCIAIICLAVEFLNSAIESAIDRSGLHRDEFGKRGKDASATCCAIFYFVFTLWCLWVISLRIKN